MQLFLGGCANPLHVSRKPVSSRGPYRGCSGLPRPYFAGQPRRRQRLAATAAAGDGGAGRGPWTRLLEAAQPAQPPALSNPQSEAERGGEQAASGKPLYQAQPEGLPQAYSRSSEGSGSGLQPMDVAEVYENQRFYGVGWKAPLSVLDAPEWSDVGGSPVILQQAPSADPSWEPVVTAATDDDGWQYATVFKHLEYKRPGGRACARFGDTVRRRLWRRRPGVSPASATATAVPVEAATEAAAAGAAALQGSGSAAAVARAASSAAEQRAAREAEAKKKAVKQFVGMVLDLLSRRPMWSLVPWDPAAPFLLYQKHQQVYQELQAQAYQRRLFTADQPAPPSQLREGRTLLQDLLCAALHSRAAYGYPATIGGLRSVGDYVRLYTLQPLTFDAVGGASAEANTESLAALAGIDVGDVVAAEWRNTPFRPCHYVAIDRANQCIVLSIRGSLQAGDLLSDLVAAPMEVRLGGTDGWVHQGIFAAATYVHCNTRRALEEAARRCPGWPLLLTGHSLGGGVAALLALLLEESGLPRGMGAMRCVTLGTAAVMSAPLAQRCEQLVTSVVVGSDVVPHLSLASVEALLLEASEASPVRRTVTGWSSKLAGVLSAVQSKVDSSQGDVVGAAASVAASAALSNAKIAGSWSALKDASAALGRSASGAGLARLLSAGRQQQAGQAAAAARQIPILVQQQALEPEWPQRLQQQQPQAIPVIQERAGQQQVEGQLPGTSAAGATPSAPTGEPLPEMLLAAEVAGLEGSHAGGQAAAPAAAGGQQAAAQQLRQQGGQEGSQPLPYFCEFDSPLAETAMAQEAEREEAAAASGAPPPAPYASSGGGPGSPELLFPPGRIIWLFPGDEDMSGVQEEAEQQLEAMEAAWQGGASPARTLKQRDRDGAQAEDAQPGLQAQQAQQQVAAAAGSGSRAGASRGRYDLTNMDAEERGRGAVDMGEAMQAVEEGGGGGQGDEGGQAQRRACVAVDADRSSFERLLIMADMLNDHLPDRYLAALQQL